MSRLANEISPYLQAHRNNPIDWFPWGEEAFAKAKQRNVPVLVSIGYHTCHWCHVMARESFEDPRVAEVVNDHLVSIKVDREERPDVDSHYMLAAQAFSSHLGWPLNVFVTPDGHPFYAATYLPPSSTTQLPAFLDVVRAVSTAWRERRDEVEASAGDLTQSLRVALGHRDPDQVPHFDGASVIASVLAAEDKEFGGFFGAPKFPMAPVLAFLLDTAPDPAATALARRTLETIAGSELRDPIEGGFFRYATMRDWTTPHFERMLCDNALLLSCYSRIGDLAVAGAIVSFLRNVMTVDGGFASAQHSESVLGGEPSEGGYYALDAAARAQVTPPELDRKVITGWMGLALAGLADAEQAGIDEAGAWGGRLARVLLSRHRPQQGTLHRVSIDGRLSAAPATLDDFGGLAWGLVKLGIVTADLELCLVAKELVDECAQAGKGEKLVRSNGGDALIEVLSGGERDLSEGATPSGEALIAVAAVRLGALTGDDNYRRLAKATVLVGQATVAEHPLGAGGLAGALWAADDTHVAVVVVDDDTSSALREVASRVVSGRATVVCVTRKQAADFAAAGFEAFAHRDEVSGVAYVCRGTVCDRPDRSAQELSDHLVHLRLLLEPGGLPS